MAFKLQITGLRFDSAAIEEAVDSATRANLSAGGALTRKIQQQSMRYGDKPSPPGSPPTAHRGGGSPGKGPFLRKFVQFSYDPSTRSVVIGPAKLGRSNAPEVMEKGGVVKRRVRVRGARAGRTTSTAQAAAFRRKLAAGSLRGGPVKTVETSFLVEPRPSADPALIKAKPKLAGAWADSVKP